MTAGPFENLLVDRDGAVATITINRPKVLNALNTQTLDELRRAILDLAHDDSVRVVRNTSSARSYRSPCVDPAVTSAWTRPGSLDGALANILSSARPR